MGPRDSCGDTAEEVQLFSPPCHPTGPGEPRHPPCQGQGLRHHRPGPLRNCRVWRVEGERRGKKRKIFNWIKILFLGPPAHSLASLLILTGVHFRLAPQPSGFMRTSDGPSPKIRSQAWPEAAFSHSALLQGSLEMPRPPLMHPASRGPYGASDSWTLCPCASQREDEIEAIISISDGLNLVSTHSSQPLAARRAGLPANPS